MPPEMDRHEAAFSMGEFRHFALGLLLNPEITWVNPIDKVAVGEHKLYQLRLATKLGFRTPRTLVSRDSVALEEFVSTNERGTICKPIFHGMFFDEQSSYSIYTRRVKPESFSGKGRQSCPVFLQEEIPRDADVRATFIGDQCFACDIVGNDGLVDWRDPSARVHYTECQLDDAAEDRCRRMLSELGLLYGAFDFIRSDSGELVFLEVNPTGEWAWLEKELGFRMREAFVTLPYGSSK